MTCAIGDPAGTENVYLKIGGRFEQPIEFNNLDGSPWNLPAGTVVELVFGDPVTPIEVWPAAADENTALFTRTAAQIAAARTTIPAGTAARIRMTVPPATDPEVKTVGMVIWQ